MNRDDMAEMALALRAEGAIYREIADTLGISRSYACELCLDPTGCGARKRKDRYRLPCPGCGGLMDGSNGHGTNRPRQCAKCAASDPPHLVWTREAILECLRCYDELPDATTWLVTPTRGDRPSVETIQRVFGSWNAAWKAAGFEPRPRGVKRADIAKRQRLAS